MMMKAGKAEVTTKLATYRFCRDVKRLAARMLDAGKENNWKKCYVSWLPDYRSMV